MAKRRQRRLIVDEDKEESHSKKIKDEIQSSEIDTHNENIDQHEENINVEDSDKNVGVDGNEKIEENENGTQYESVVQRIKYERELELSRLLREYNRSGDEATLKRILDRLREFELEDDSFMQNLTDKEPRILIDWFRPWYQRGGTGVTRTVKNDNPDHPDQFRSDHLTKDEDDLIYENWVKFVKKFDIPDNPQLFARWRNKDKNKRSLEEFLRFKITAHLARGLKRTLPQVYKHFVTSYAFPVKGPYSEMELQIMNICFSKYDKDAIVMLSKILGREPRGIYNRFNVYEKGVPEKKRVKKWTLELAKKLIKALILHSACSLEELEGKQISYDVWVKVQEDMNVPYDHLKKFWYRKLHVQLFADIEVRLSRIKRRVYKTLKKSTYKRWQDIRWNEVVDYFPKGFTSVFLHSVSSNFFRVHCRNYLSISLEELLRVWKTNKVMYKNKQLKLLHYDSQHNKLRFLEGARYESGDGETVPN